MNQIEKKYHSVAQKMLKELDFKSIMEVPRIEKIVINSGIKDGVTNPKAVNEMQEQLTIITGQKAIITKAKKSIAVFKLREGMPIGVKVTLRGAKMYDFLSKLINIALPRVRDFRGLNKNSFDNQANYSLGVKEQIIFPEIDFDKINKIKGMDITIVCSSNKREHVYYLLKELGLPFQK